jgi:hypothetical protein
MGRPRQVKFKWGIAADSKELRPHIPEGKRRKSKYYSRKFRHSHLSIESS